MIKEIMLVVAVLDGDTIKAVNDTNNQYTVRLASIDAPEKNQPYGKESTDSLKKIIGYQKVLLDCPSQDRYQRLICTISHDGKDINLYQVEQGAAWVYRQYYSGTEYIAAENKAKSNNVGLWSGAVPPIEPWIWRKHIK